MDAGPGSLAELLRHTTLDQLDAVWISHLHLDHVGDLLNAYYALAYGLLPPLARPLPVYAPAALGKRLAGFFEQEDARLPQRRTGAAGAIRWALGGLGGLELLSRAVEHGCDAYGLRASAEGRSWPLRDCAPCPSRTRWHGVDLLLFEADSGEETAVHHTPEQAGALARRTGYGGWS